MATVEIKTMPTRKKIIPLVLSIAHVMMKELRFVEIINETVSWDRAHWNISPGSLAKMLVMGTFTDIRVPLTHLEDRLESIDVTHFLDSDDKSDYVNSYNVGEAMDRISKVDYNGLYEKIALSAVQRYEMPITRLHADTTTIPFYGDYDIDDSKLTEEERQEYLRIERGYNKDGRPLDNQVVVGQIVNEHGIPVVSRTMNGGTSDIDWNREAIKYAEQIFARGFDKGIFVADSKLITKEHVTAMNHPEKRIHFVSRCPANFDEKLEEWMITRAYTVPPEQWNIYGSIGEGKDAAQYRGVSIIEEVCGAPMRLLVLESSKLKEKAKEAFVKKESEVEGPIKKLEKGKWACQADAEEALNCFLDTKPLRFFKCKTEITRQVQEKWPKGRRRADTKPECTESYHIHILEINKRESAYQTFMRNESCIVLISNAPDEVSDEEILRTYKGQQVVENSFRMLKSPSLASVIYLKSPERIKVLSMLLTFSLLLRALIQYRLREGLRKHKEAHPNKKVYAGWGGRLLEAPTFKLFYEHAINCCFEREDQDHYSFSWLSVEMKSRVSPLLEMMGYSLEQLMQ